MFGGIFSNVLINNHIFRDDVVVPFKLGQALHKAALTSRQPDWPEVSATLLLSLPYMQIRIRAFFVVRNLNSDADFRQSKFLNYSSH